MTKHANNISHYYNVVLMNQSLSCILNFKPLFVTIFLCFSLISFLFSPRGKFVLQTEILNKFIIYCSSQGVGGGEVGGTPDFK